VVCLESGWVATEVGRQPWTVWQVLRTTDAASMSSGLWWSYLGFVVVYVGMTVGAYVVLRSMARRWRAGEEDLPSPYGPAVVESRR
jgi:cytochrome d ubiquinol oxidase subunit I